MNVTIVGRGPSLLGKAPTDFPDGPIIVLNSALYFIRTLDLHDHLIYTMQKDGCVAHTSKQDFYGPWKHCDGEHGACGGNKQDMILPKDPEHLLVTKVQSRYCWPDYAPRTVIDVEALGLDWTTMSAPTAVVFAVLQLGAKQLTMIGHDGYIHDDFRVVNKKLHVTEHGAGPGYASAGFQCEMFAQSHGIAPDWRE